MKTFTVLVRPEDFDNALLLRYTRDPATPIQSHLLEALRSPPHSNRVARGSGDYAAI
jgi:hypothetical protein